MRVHFFLTALAAFCPFVCAASVKHDDSFGGSLLPEAIENYGQENYNQAPQDGHVLSRRFDIPQDDTTRARNLLESFVRDLKSFVNDTSFDYISFGAQIDVYGLTISNIDTMVKRILPHDPLLIQQLVFARHMFDVMVVSVHHLTTARAGNDASHNLLYNTAQLRILCLVMLRTQTAGDRQFPDYANRVILLRGRSNRLHGIFTNLVDTHQIPFVIRMIVWDYIVRSESLIAVLERPA